MREDLMRSFTEMATAQAPGLRRFAYAVCADPDRADDLVQRALERVLVAWPRAHRADDHGAYCRTVLARLAVDDSRRSWFRRERSTDRLPQVAQPDQASAIGDRLDLAQALSGLTRRQRAVVVLRYLEDRPIRDVASILGVGEAP